ncbi:MAG: hypothetical protein KBF31_07275 [Chitinophagales bacterium]|nr:hypothetical protein [Chitinophagales bacterium]
MRPSLSESLNTSEDISKEALFFSFAIIETFAMSESLNTSEGISKGALIFSFTIIETFAMSESLNTSEGISKEALAYSGFTNALIQKLKSFYYTFN